MSDSRPAGPKARILSLRKIAACERTQSLSEIPSRLSDVGEAIPLLMTHSIEPWLASYLSEVTISWIETPPWLP